MSTSMHIPRVAVLSLGLIIAISSPITTFAADGSSVAAKPTAGLCDDSARYAGTTGNDSNPGTEERPYLTLQKALTGIGPGATICVSEGRYASFLLENVHGAADAWITIRPKPGHSVVIDRYLDGNSRYRAAEFTASSYIILEGFEITDSNPLKAQHRDCNLVADLDGCAQKYAENYHGQNGIKINSTTDVRSHHIVLRQLELHDLPGQAILGGGEDFLIEHNHIHHNGVISEGYGMYIGGSNHNIRDNVSHDNNGHGIRTGNGSVPLFNSVIERNITYNNRNDFIHFRKENFVEPVREPSGSGILIWHGDNNIVRNNIAYGNGSWGVRIRGHLVGNNQVVNNTIYNNGDLWPDFRYGIYVNREVGGNSVKNNIIYDNVADILPGSGNTTSPNLLGATNPQFVDLANFDFHLTPNSPAIDAGETMGDVGEDFDGMQRPQGNAHDMGAFEFVIDDSPPERPQGVIVQ